MGNLIGVNGDIEKVKAHVRISYGKAVALGGSIGEAAQQRMAEALAALDAAEEGRETAGKEEQQAWNAVLAESAKSDIVVSTVRDTLWNALGRPRPSPAMDQLFPDGLWTYAPADKRHQPRLMKVLGSRLLTVPAPLWGKQLRETLAAQVETHRESYQRALETHEPADAAAQIARSVYKAAVRTAHDRLRAFKRDLLSLGMNEAAIHEIIPDATRPEHGGREEEPTKQAA